MVPIRVVEAMLVGGDAVVDGLCHEATSPTRASTREQRSLLLADQGRKWAW